MDVESPFRALRTLRARLARARSARIGAVLQSRSPSASPPWERTSAETSPAWQARCGTKPPPRIHSLIVRRGSLVAAHGCADFMISIRGHGA